VIRCFATMIGLLAGLPAIVQAQTNLDQGKVPAQIFANHCAACHKPTRRLAHGMNGFALTEFLREHYTTSREQAAGLAAYVLRAGLSESGSEVRRGQKPEQAKPITPAEEAPTTGAEPSSVENSMFDSSSTSTAATPSIAEPGEATPVPRDDIPD
jgi:hypothetical protein